jgi:hypothetical protein
MKRLKRKTGASLRFDPVATIAESLMPVFAAFRATVPE